MTVNSKQEAWNKVNEIFPTAYEQDMGSSERAGYPIYRSTSEGHYYDYICDLGSSLEVNLDSSHQPTVRINIVEPVQESSEEDKAEDEIMKARIETARRIQRATYLYTEEYVKEMDNRKREIAAEKEAQERYERTGKIEMIVMTAENNAKVMMDCITDCIHAVNILKNKEEDVEPWMLAGINAMMDKANEDHIIPFDLPTSICGLLCAQYR